MKHLLILCFVFFLTNIAQAQNDNNAATTSTETAKVFFMRSTGFQGSATAFTVFIDDSIVCRLNNKKYSIHTISPGTHQFSVQFAGKKAKEKAERIEINAEAGKTYYIQLIFQGGAFVNNLYCQEVTENSANKVLPGLKLDGKCE